MVLVLKNQKPKKKKTKIWLLTFVFFVFWFFEKPKSSSQVLVFGFSNQKLSLGFWLGVPGLLALKTCGFFGFWLFEKPKTKTPVFVFLQVPGLIGPETCVFLVVGFSKNPKHQIKLKNRWFLSYFLTTDNKIPRFLLSFEKGIVYVTSKIESNSDLEKKCAFTVLFHEKQL